MSARACSVALALVFALGACGSRGDEPATSRPDASAQLRATVILEPTRLEVGDTAVVEIAVVTPPGWRVPPARPPEAVEGIWLLDAERPALVEEPTRWVHRNRFRIRARAPGPFEWPATPIEAEDPEGRITALSAGPRAFEVVAVSPEYPDQRSFLSYLRPPEARSDTSPWLAGAVGALLAFASIGLVALVRRVRRASESAPGPAPSESAPWRATQASLETASSIALSDPVRAADLASTAVRVYVARRFDAEDVLAATTQELADREAPFLLTTRWAPLLGVLESLDGVRFLPLRDPDAMREAARAAIAEAQALIVDMSPRGNTR